MEYRMMIQGTPNPNALKFVLNTPIKNEGNATYKNTEECTDNPLARAIFSISNVKEIYFFDNYITVTQDGTADWDSIEEQLKKTILENIADHDPNFKGPQPVQVAVPKPDNPELLKIDAILNETIRPALQMDGGDLQVMNLDGNVLTISYQGACGSCPTSTAGTLKAIENLLRDEYNPEIVVELG
ncbi:MAG: NifU family protein [Candidatus Omnitrophica bacterium]|nr:NifU family protein [Candidatus Omnitrophota bacterium]